jgi:hypothetical protein
LKKARLVVLTALVIVFHVACSNISISTEAIDDPNVIYHDDFTPESTGLWRFEGDELGTTAIDGEQLTIDVRSPNTIQFTTLQEAEFSDFELKIEATLLDGAPNSTLGILFRIQDSGEFYRFELMNDGHYIVERYDGDDVWTRLINDWTFSEAILSGQNTNHLKIVANGPIMSFYVNEELLQEVTDTAFSNGYVGLDAGTFGSGLTVASFDNLVLSNP